MALSASVLSALMRSKLLAASATSRAVDCPELTALCDCLAQACVEHVVAAAVVNVTVATTGTAAAQTGTGVGAIT